MNKILVPDTTTFNRCKEVSNEGYSYTLWFCAPAGDGSGRRLARFHCFQSNKRLESVAEVIMAIEANIVNGQRAVDAIFANGIPDFSNAVINEGYIDDLPEEGEVCFCGTEG